MKTFSKKPRLTVFTFTAMALVGAANSAQAQDLQVDELHMDKSSLIQEGADAKKMLSEMTDLEKATLSEEEYQMLKELEMKGGELDVDGLTEQPDLGE